MDIGLVGEGPAAEAVEAALADIDVNRMSVEATLLDGFDLAVVVGTAGSATFAAANDRLDRWVAVEVGGIGGVPLAAVDAAVTVFDGTCYDCLRRRVAASEPDHATSPTGTRSAVRYAGALAGRRTIRLLSGDAVGDTVVEVPGPERTLLPVPGCGCGGAPDGSIPRDHAGSTLEDAISRAERAVDPRIGPLREVGEQSSFPLPYYVAATAETTHFSDARAAEFAGGADGDWNVAFMKALGEGLERYAAGIYRQDAFTNAPADDVSNPIPPDAFVRPADADDYDRDDPLPWTTGEDLETGEPVSLPAEFVHFPPPERRYRPAITTGLGLGNSGPEALLSGLYETIERDATMTAWYSTIEPLGLEVEDDAVTELCKRARAESLTVTPLLLTTDIDVPVVAVGVHRDDDWPRFAAGSGADLDPVAAVRSALAEALQNWVELRGMGPERAVDEGAAIGYHADFPEVTREFFDPDASVPVAGLGDPERSGADELAAVLARLQEVGLDAYAARTTTRDVAALGFEAVRVLVPAAQPLFTREPFFGDRAHEVPRSMGFEPRLDAEYHPFP
ncbi:YcaO-like family protein [Halorubrum vacuolatum]|uniref:Ribosomal protein S12 methylthiotransferase accessory factor n=1 Tax=Halorubrum vacuolatum TaxID=63740 RepID=A0A238X1X4_HALVU|nr:YcaO-like family protein [Halorubrum vacuolatum]SNR52742.1 ribosomal protein S12 methylthiotransferase accessory factor [Halorubrum vacuolatum]